MNPFLIYLMQVFWLFGAEQILDIYRHEIHCQSRGRTKLCLPSLRCCSGGVRDSVRVQWDLWRSRLVGGIRDTSQVLNVSVEEIAPGLFWGQVSSSRDSAETT